MDNLPKQVQEQLEELQKNIKRISDLETDIKVGKDAATGVAELKEEVHAIAQKNSDLVDSIKSGVEKEMTDRQDAFEAKMKEALKTAGTPGSDLQHEIATAVKSHGLGQDWRGRASFEVKNITNLAGSAGPLLVPQYQQGVDLPGRQGLAVRQLLGGGTTDSTVIVYFREKTADRTDGVAYQKAQGDPKGQSDFEFEQYQATVKDIAHWTYISRQMLADVGYIRGLLEGEMRYMLEYFEEKEILNGAGNNGEMEGLNTAADSFDTDLLGGVTAAQKLDILRKAMVQVGRTFFPATGIILNPEDVADIELLKDGENRYLWVNPTGVAGRRFWGLPTVETYAQEAGEFTVGAFAVAADYWQRQGVRVEISTEDGDNFRRNRATLLVEKRGTTAIKRPSTIIHGTFPSA